MVMMGSRSVFEKSLKYDERYPCQTRSVCSIRFDCIERPQVLMSQISSRTTFQQLEARLRPSTVYCYGIRFNTGNHRDAQNSCWFYLRSHYRVFVLSESGREASSTANSLSANSHLAESPRSGVKRDSEIRLTSGQIPDSGHPRPPLYYLSLLQLPFLMDNAAKDKNHSGPGAIETEGDGQTRRPNLTALSR